MNAAPQISVVIATHNRREALLTTLHRLLGTAAEASGHEIIVIDNNSKDNTGSALRLRYPDVRLIALTRNLGSCAKAIGVDQARGQYLVFLDDDSAPRPGSIARMIARFEADDRLGAAGFMIHLPNGTCECSALPNVFVGCGVGFRREALQTVGGLDRTLFMQAEEYDLSFRLIAAGWEVRTFTDLHVEHLKTSQNRLNRRTVYYDTRNNLILTARYLPDAWEAVFRQDWAQRYRWLAGGAGHLAAYWRARIAGARRRARERRAYARWRLTPAAFEQLFRFDEIARRMAKLAETGARRIVLADLGKNIYPFVRSARRAGLAVTCIADDRFAHPRRRYRGVPIRTTAQALDSTPDTIVISNTSPVHAAASEGRLANLTHVPIHRWFGYDLWSEGRGGVAAECGPGPARL